MLWRPEKSTFGLNFYARNKQINTEELLFTPGNITTAATGEQTLSLKLISEEGKYIEYLYTLSPDSYMVDFSIHTQNMNDVIAANSSFLTLFWGVFGRFAGIGQRDFGERLFQVAGLLADFGGDHDVAE